MSQTTRPKILVVGDLMLDHYLWSHCQRISPEAPVPVFEVDNQKFVLGGAGNVINNLHALDAEIGVISVIGDDKVAQDIKHKLEALGINLDYLVIEAGRKTAKKVRLFSAKQQIVRYDEESTQDIDQASEAAVAQHFKRLIKQFNLVILSDYGKGILTGTLTPVLINHAQHADIKVLVDPKGQDYTKYQNAYTLTPNKKEAGQALKMAIGSVTSLKQATKQLKADYHLQVAMITLSEEGIALFDNKFAVYPTMTKEVFDVIGAGDAVIAALGFALASGQSIQRAVQFANLAAGIVVGKLGAATASHAEIDTLQTETQLTPSRIVDRDNISRICRSLKAQNKSIVFTNGCFDLLHLGHVQYLEQAKACGDVLIVGVNSDDSVRRLKGKNRPINPAYDRAYLVAAQKVVDYVVIFSESTPRHLISAIKPNVLVKGGDYQASEVVGYELADSVHIIPFIANKSTSHTIEAIKNSYKSSRSESN